MENEPVLEIDNLRFGWKAGSLDIDIDRLEINKHSRVFMDGRFRSAYSDACIKDYLDLLYQREGWEAAMARHPTDLALLHRDNLFTETLRTMDGWEVAHEAGPAVLFLKQDVHGEVLARIRAGAAARFAAPSGLFP